ncbi:NAD(P)-binding protein [Aspergillus ibericus CBS 121593]|uniref:NAD(P)-binding protein n=1 Tax=Aspergillus ibericus CBS 121593 TaxID=1448316 RepID=A0A395GKR1_9EURO|nr:NAD(P)-binding protein [Aspergillus ibericus CBS 121593]RAK96090.1 NAD(P)-binding protein [Aspergillus ibericus CBS 121593]
MVRVAIAGGTGGVGRTILEVLNTSSDHQAYVLSRQPSNSPNTLTVDYSNIPELTSTLETNQIHTVISAFAVAGDSLATSQLNLIEAAIQSKTTERFIPSGYAIPYPEQSLKVLPQLKDYFKAIEILRASRLQWTIFVNGIFLDYFGPPTLRSYLKPNVFVVDLESRVAAIPGDGNVPVTFTYTFDLARFVVAALDLPEWPEESRVVGDELTWNEFVGPAESILGTKFTIHHDSVEKLQRFEVTELPGHRALYKHFPRKAFQWFMATFELFTTDGSSRIMREGALNERFPEIHTLTVKELLERYWQKRE